MAMPGAGAGKRPGALVHVTAWHGVGLGIRSVAALVPVESLEGGAEVLA